MVAVSHTAGQSQDESNAEGQHLKSGIRIVGLAFFFVVGNQFITLGGISLESVSIFPFLQRRQEGFRESSDAIVIGDLCSHFVVRGNIPIPGVHGKEEHHISFCPIRIGFVQELVGKFPCFRAAGGFHSHHGDAHMMRLLYGFQRVRNFFLFRFLQKARFVHEGRRGRHGFGARQEEEHRANGQYPLKYFFHSSPLLTCKLTGILRGNRESEAE